MTAAKDNPFATERIEKLLPFEPAWIGESWDSILARFDRHQWRGTIVGPQGSGKTTFFETLTKRLRNLGDDIAPLFINRQKKQIDPQFFTRLRPETLILFDGAEQMNWLAWQKFVRKTRHTRGLLITAHRRLRLPTVLETKASPQTLDHCIRALNAGSAGSSPEVSALFQRHRGNIRHALLECYDDAAALS